MSDAFRRVMRLWPRPPAGSDWRAIEQGRRFCDLIAKSARDAADVLVLIDGASELWLRDHHGEAHRGFIERLAELAMIGRHAVDDDEDFGEDEMDLCLGAEWARDIIVAACAAGSPRPLIDNIRVVALKYREMNQFQLGILSHCIRAAYAAKFN
jgi:hypothetical protein